MEYVAFLIEKGNMSYYEVMKLPVVKFASLLKQFFLKQNLQDEDYRKQYEKLQYMNIKEGDLNAIRKITGYKTKKD